MITRHFINVGNRRIHYRSSGSGPPLLMVHQSPRSSREYEDLMQRWGTSFTCIAPDTPGFGQSDPLPGAPEIDDFADALVALLDALGLERVPAYGFHSGGIILVTAMRRHPQRFAGLAVGGYAIWTEQEMQTFGEHYLPPFEPSPYGEHLIWLWNRILEQSWFFPWFDVPDGRRLPNAHDDPHRVHKIVMEMLDAGDAYRAGYGAVLRAPRDIPAADAVTAPVLISAYDGDPLQQHIDRLGPFPANWHATKVATVTEHHAVSLEFLKPLAGASVAKLPEADDAGFAHVTTDDFDGLLHWRGDQVDPPGHGLSDAWPGKPPEYWAPWAAVFDAYESATGRRVTLPPLPVGDTALLYPDLEPDRFGSYLTKAWSIARAEALFEPWYDVRRETVLPVDPAQLEPHALAARVRDRLRTSAARALHVASLSRGER